MRIVKKILLTAAAVTLLWGFHSIITAHEKCAIDSLIQIREKRQNTDADLRQVMDDLQRQEAGK